MTELLSAYTKETHLLLFRVYAQEIPAAERRERAKLSHLAAWDLLGAALYRDFGIRHIRVKRTGLEKPQLVHETLHMNLSHCAGLAVCAVGTVPVGIDAEPPRPVREALLPRMCTPEETAYILAQEDRNFAFSRIWTLKEAYGKLSGEGIRMNLQNIGFRLVPHLQLTAPELPDLRLIQLTQENRYAVSVCIRYENAFDVEKNENWEMNTNGNGIVLCQSDTGKDGYPSGSAKV